MRLRHPTAQLAPLRPDLRQHPDGDDLFHEALLRACARLGDLRDEGRFRAWFYAVLLSQHRALVRRRFFRRLLSLEALEALEGPPPDDPGPDPEEQIGGAALMARALAALPAVQREAVVLHEVDGFSLLEIAQMQGASLSAVKTRLCRGRERLRARYEALLREGAPAAGLLPAAARKETRHG
jgi:RNA polymerase sigma-70 factor (ECF subfamily)